MTRQLLIEAAWEVDPTGSSLELGCWCLGLAADPTGSRLACVVLVADPTGPQILVRLPRAGVG